MTIEEKILKILNEEVPYEVIGGPTPNETLQGQLDYAKLIDRAHVPQANLLPGVGTTGVPTHNTDLDISMAGHHEDKDSEEDKEDKDPMEESFASLLRRLVEEDDETPTDGEPKETLPGKEIDSLNDHPEELVTQAPGSPMAEDDMDMDMDESDDMDDDHMDMDDADKKDDEDDKEDDDKDDDGSKKDKKELDEDEPKITLPYFDSLNDDPDALVNTAPGSPMAEDLKAMFAGLKLTEDSKAKIATIYKAAVVRGVNENKRAMAKKAAKALTEAFGVLKTSFAKKQKVFESKLSGQVDGYLNYVVENWMQENKLAVERGIRAELAENFIAGLKKLFVENYIEVPESKVDVVATLGNKVTNLESKLNEALDTNIQMRTTLNNYRKIDIVRSVSAGLTDVQSDKLAKLAEGVEFTTRKEFVEKLTSLKESYFPKVAAPIKKEEPLMESVTTSFKDDDMARYTNAISKSKK